MFNFIKQKKDNNLKNRINSSKDTLENESKSSKDSLDQDIKAVNDSIEKADNFCDGLKTIESNKFEYFLQNEKEIFNFLNITESIIDDADSYINENHKKKKNEDMMTAYKNLIHSYRRLELYYTQSIYHYSSQKFKKIEEKIDITEKILDNRFNNLIAVALNIVITVSVVTAVLGVLEKVDVEYALFIIIGSVFLISTVLILYIAITNQSKIPNRNLIISIIMYVLIILSFFLSYKNIPNQKDNSNNKTNITQKNKS